MKDVEVTSGTWGLGSAFLAAVCRIDRVRNQN